MSRTSDEKPDQDEAKPDEAAPERAGRTRDKASSDNAQDKMAERLDEGLEETFPSSDPVSVKITK